MISHTIPTSPTAATSMLSRCLLGSSLRSTSSNPTHRYLTHTHTHVCVRTRMRAPGERKRERERKKKRRVHQARVHTNTYTKIHTHTYTHIHTHAHTHTCTHAHTHITTRTHTRTHTHTSCTSSLGLEFENFRGPLLTGTYTFVTQIQSL